MLSGEGLHSDSPPALWYMPSTLLSFLPRSQIRDVDVLFAGAEEISADT